MRGAFVAKAGQTRPADHVQASRPRAPTPWIVLVGLPVALAGVFLAMAFAPRYPDDDPALHATVRAAYQDQAWYQELGSVRWEDSHIEAILMQGDTDAAVAACDSLSELVRARFGGHAGAVWVYWGTRPHKLLASNELSIQDRCIPTG